MIDLKWKKRLQWFLLVNSTAGLILQLVQIINNSIDRGQSLGMGLIRYVFYFTEETNFLIVLLMSCLLAPESIRARFSNKFKRLLQNPLLYSSLASYILMVGLVYELILRAHSSGTTLSLLSNLFAHDLAPIGFLVYWRLYRPIAPVQLRDSFVSMIYPTVYMLAVSARGVITGIYPYAFLDFTKLNGSTGAVNIICLFTAFWGFHTGFLILDRELQKKSPISD